jgi:recombination associated protein RdgC
MSFESGSASFRMFYLPRGLGKDPELKFAKKALPPIESLGDGEINGWVGGRHLLDRKITVDNAYFGGFLRLTLVQAMKKVPESLLRAECKIEELAQLQASGADHLSASARSEIRRSVEDRLLPKMPPTLKGVPFVHDDRADILYASAMSEKQVDAFTIMFSEATGTSLVPVTAETASLRRTKSNTRDWTPSSFSPEIEDEFVLNEPGQDFLTWLWFVSEARGGMLKIGDLGSIAVMLEGPLTFTMEGEGAHVTVLRRGEPLLSAEAKTCLLSGKKLRSAKLTLARGDESWKCTFDATFAIRGLKLTEGERLDAVSRFQSRMGKFDTFQSALLGFYDRFVEERADPKMWKKTVAEIHEWVKGRKTRR